MEEVTDPQLGDANRWDDWRLELAGGEGRASSRSGAKVAASQARAGSGAPPTCLPSGGAAREQQTDAVMLVTYRCEARGIRSEAGGLQRS
jgi:hypothetical protein